MVLTMSASEPAKYKQSIPKLKSILIDEPPSRFNETKPSAILPQKSVRIEQGQLEFFQTYNDSLYESILKVKRRNMITKYNTRMLTNVKIMKNPVVPDIISNADFVSKQPPSNTPQPSQQQRDDQHVSMSNNMRPGGYQYNTFLNKILTKRRKTSLAQALQFSKEEILSKQLPANMNGIIASKLIFNRSTAARDHQASGMMAPPVIFDFDQVESRMSHADEMPMNRIEINLQQRHLTPSEEVFDTDEEYINKDFETRSSNADQQHQFAEHVTQSESFGMLTPSYTKPSLSLVAHRQYDTNVNKMNSDDYLLKRAIRPIPCESVEARQQYSRVTRSLELMDQQRRLPKFSSLKPGGFFVKKSKSYMRNSKPMTTPSILRKHDKDHQQVETQVSQYANANELNNASFMHSDLNCTHTDTYVDYETTCEYDVNGGVRSMHANPDTSVPHVKFSDTRTMLDSNEAKTSELQKANKIGNKSNKVNLKKKNKKTKKTNFKNKSSDSILKKPKEMQTDGPNCASTPINHLHHHKEVTIYPSLINKLTTTATPSPSQLTVESGIDDQHKTPPVFDTLIADNMLSSRHATLLMSTMPDEVIETTHKASKRSRRLDEPQTLMGKLYNHEYKHKPGHTHNTHNNKNKDHSKFHWPRRVIVADKKPVVVKRQTVIKTQQIQMLELELNEIKKDDITLQSILNGLKETKINTSIGRLALSKNVCRFELPMDIKMLESMDPLQYLRSYCKVNERRKALYKRIFEKYKSRVNKEDVLNAEQLEDAIMDVHMKSIKKTQYQYILKLIVLPADILINFQLFCGIAALSERALYPQFVTEDTADLPQYQKDKIECADFESLKSKLDSVNVSETMMRLLEVL